jgi:hypothetical protein
MANTKTIKRDIEILMKLVAENKRLKAKIAKLEALDKVVPQTSFYRQQARILLRKSKNV